MQDLAGPKVSARREGTADKGGGRLEVRAGRIVVQGKLRLRDLGAAADLSSIALLDSDGMGVALSFTSGATWTLAADAVGLEPFARALETGLGRPGLVQDPPGLSVRVRAAATPETRRSVGAAALVLVAAMVVIVGTFWARDTSRRHAFEAKAAQRDAAARDDAERRASSAKASDDARVSALAEKLRAAMDQKQWRDAEALHAALTKARADHPMLRPAWATLGPALAALAEQARQAAVSAGIAATRAVLADPVQCDDAGHVAEAWKRLAQARRGDAAWRDAVLLASQLERCRALVVKAYTANATATLRDQRRRFASELPDRLRPLGLAVVARLRGRNDTELTVEVAGLDEYGANDLVTTPVSGPARLLESAATLGVRLVRLTDGTTRHFDYALDPAPMQPGVTQALAAIGLDRPLVLGDASDLPQPIKKRARRARSR